MVVDYNAMIPLEQKAKVVSAIRLLHLAETLEKKHLNSKMGQTEVGKLLGIDLSHNNCIIQDIITKNYTFHATFCQCLPHMSLCSSDAEQGSLYCVLEDTAHKEL